MRRAWVLAVLLLAACGAAGEGASPPASPERPCERRAPRIRATQPEEPAAGAGESTEATLPDETAPDDSASQHRALVVGRIVDARGEPVSDAHVVAFIGVDTWSTTAQADGTFAFGIDDPTGVVRCLAWGRGCSVAVGGWIAAHAGELADVGTLRCGHAAPVSGWIAAADGTHTFGTVTVESTDAFDVETWALIREVAALGRVEVPYRCGGAGGFEISMLPPGRYQLRAADGGEPRTVTAPASDVALPAPPIRDVPRKTELCVSLLDGSAVPDFTVCVRSTESREVVPSEFEVRDGRYFLSVKSDVAGRLAVAVTTSDGRGAGSPWDVSQSRPLQIRLPRVRRDLRHFEIRGAVTANEHGLTWEFTPDHGCTPDFSGTRVHIAAVRDGDLETSATALSDRDGTFVLEDLEEGTYRLWAKEDVCRGDPKFTTACVTAVAGDIDVQIEMHLPRSRHFRLVLPEGFACIEEADYEIRGPGGEFEPAELDRAGDDLVAKFLRMDIPYSLSVRARCGVVWTATTRVNSFTAGGDPIEIRLSPGLRIEGRVVRGDGSPVVGADVGIEVSEDRYADAYSALDGSFVLTGLDARPYSLAVSAPGLAKHETVAEAGTTALRLVMQAER